MIQCWDRFQLRLLKLLKHSGHLGPGHYCQYFLSSSVKLQTAVFPCRAQWSANSSKKQNLQLFRPGDKIQAEWSDRKSEEGLMSGQAGLSIQARYWKCFLFMSLITFTVIHEGLWYGFSGEAQYILKTWRSHFFNVAGPNKWLWSEKWLTFISFWNSDLSAFSVRLASSP